MKNKKWHYMDGRRFGNLTVLKTVYDGAIKKCECECICGNKLTITYNKLISSKIRDCGCGKRREL